MKKLFLNNLKKTVDVELKRNSNSTTCFTIYQPQAPAALKKFSKIDK